MIRTKPAVSLIGMDKRRARGRRRGVRRRPDRQKRDASRAVEAVTIAWSLTVMTVLGCDVGLAVVRIYVHFHPASVRMALLSQLLLLSAAVLAILDLALLPVVVRIRHEPPPRGFVVLAVLVAIGPLAALAALAAS